MTYTDTDTHFHAQKHTHKHTQRCKRTITRTNNMHTNRRAHTGTYIHIRTCTQNINNAAGTPTYTKATGGQWCVRKLTKSILKILRRCERVDIMLCSLDFNFGPWVLRASSSDFSNTTTASLTNLTAGVTLESSSRGPHHELRCEWWGDVRRK